MIVLRLVGFFAFPNPSGLSMMESGKTGQISCDLAQTYHLVNSFMFPAPAFSSAIFAFWMPAIPRESLGLLHNAEVS